MPSIILTTNSRKVNICSHHLLIENFNPDNNSSHTAKVPLFDIDRVIVAGSPNISVPVLKQLCKKGIPLFLTSSKGKWLGSLTSDNNLNAARRIKQYENSLNTEKLTACSKKLIYCKIKNSRRALQRLAANRKISANPDLTLATDRLKYLAKSLARTDNLDSIRGVEGMAASIYFAQLSQFFPENIPFNGRNRRPPKDEANAILSYTYAIVQSEIDGAIRAHGLDTAIGSLHCVSHGTPALALDLLEPLRAPVADLFVLFLLNHQIFLPKHFRFDAKDGGVYLQQSSHKEFFFYYERHMNRLFTPSKGAPHTSLRQIIDWQVCQYLKFLEDDDSYDFFKMP
ncbi:MAG: CRISPR-associated endonuclease Cas1 [Lentisphaeria bacterium]